MDFPTLSLYPPGRELAPVETVSPLALDPGCQRCALAKRVKRPCIPAEGRPGGVQVVFDAPTAADDHAGRVAWGSVGQYVRGAVRNAIGADADVAFDLGVRCAPGDGNVTSRMVAACRPYLRSTITAVHPQRIVAIGPLASEALLGYRVGVRSPWGGYGWLNGWEVPVFFLPPISGGIIANRFLRSRWEHYLRRALAGPLPPLPPLDAQVRIVDTRERAQAAADHLRSTMDGVAFDFETTGTVHGHDFRPVVLSLCAVGESSPYVVPPEVIGDRELIAPLIDLLGDPEVPKVGQNVKFDSTVAVSAWGVDPQPVYADTRLWAKLLDADAAADLDSLSAAVGMGDFKGHVAPLLTAAARRLVKAAKDDGRSIDNPKAYAYAELSREELLRYAGGDTVSTAAVAALLEPALRAEPDLWATWDRTVSHASWALAHVERWGFRADVGAIQSFSAALGADLAPVEARLRAVAGNPEFNPGSFQQVGELLYKRLRLPVLDTTPGGAPSTDDRVLNKLRGKHSAVADLIAYRSISKMRGTYADGMLRHVRPDGRVHTSYLVDGAGTGRLSSADPNMQNIPRPDTDYGRLARNVFTASWGRKLLQADFSQLELRIAAMLSGDERMIEIYRSGIDYHWRTAQLIAPKVWGKRPEDVAPKGPERSKAKVVNFRLLYGSTDYGLAMELGCSVEEAAAIRDAIFGAFPRLAQWVRERVAETRKTGVAWTWWDGRRARRRPLWAIADPDEYRRRNAENSAFNTPAQGTASEFCLMSLIEIVRRILRQNLSDKVVATVHDSIVLDVEPDRLEPAARMVQEVMTSWPSGDVPLAVDLEVGFAWGSLEKYELAAA